MLFLACFGNPTSPGGSPGGCPGGCPGGRLDGRPDGRPDGPGLSDWSISALTNAIAIGQTKDNLTEIIAILDLTKSYLNNKYDFTFCPTIQTEVKTGIEFAANPTPLGPETQTIPIPPINKSLPPINKSLPPIRVCKLNAYLTAARNLLDKILRQVNYISCVSKIFNDTIYVLPNSSGPSNSFDSCDSSSPPNSSGSPNSHSFPGSKNALLTTEYWTMIGGLAGSILIIVVSVIIVHCSTARMEKLAEKSPMVMPGQDFNHGAFPNMKISMQVDMPTDSVNVQSKPAL